MNNQTTTSGSVNKKAAISTLKQIYLETKKRITEKNNATFTAGENFFSLQFATETGELINLSISEGGAK